MRGVVADYALGLLGARDKNFFQQLKKKRWMRKRHLCTTFKLRTNSFCRQRAGLEVLTKVT